MPKSPLAHLYRWKGETFGYWVYGINFLCYLEHLGEHGDIQNLGNTQQEPLGNSMETHLEQKNILIIHVFAYIVHVLSRDNGMEFFTWASLTAHTRCINLELPWSWNLNGWELKHRGWTAFLRWQREDQHGNNF